MLNLNTSEKNWASTMAARFEHKLRAVRERSAEKIPNRAVDGVHNNKIFEGNRDDADGICWWTNGFWAGMLWQAYHATHDDRYAEIARFTERTLDECFSCYYGLHHDVGFMWLPSAVADYRLTGGRCPPPRSARRPAAGRAVQPGRVYPRVERFPRPGHRYPRLGDHRLPVQYSAFVLGERGNQRPAFCQNCDDPRRYRGRQLCARGRQCAPYRAV